MASLEVCEPKSAPPDGAIKLSVSSRAPITNPAGWRDLWLLSPFSNVAGGVEVPGLGGIRSATVENAWQFLKVWPGQEGWDRDMALQAFASTCAIRYPRGPGARALGSWWEPRREIISYAEARRRIYVPCYVEMLKRPDRWALVERIRALAESQSVWIWDFDSYRVSEAGLPDYGSALDHLQRPFAHAFIVAIAVAGELDRWLSLFSLPES